MTLLEITILIQRRWRYIFFIAVAASGFFFLAGQLFIQYEVRSTALIRPIGDINISTQAPKIPSTGLVFSTEIGLLEKVRDSYSQLLKQRTLIRETIHKLGWVKEPNKKVGNLEFIKQGLRFLVYGRTQSTQNPMERLIDLTSKNIKVQFVSKSSVLEIKVRNKDAQKAADFANGLLNTFVSHSKAHNQEVLQSFRKRIEIELQDCKSDLKEQQKRLHQITKKLGLPVFVDIINERSRLEKKLQLLEDEEEQRRFDKPLLLFQLQLVKKNLSHFPEFRLDSYDKQYNTLIDTLKTQLIKLQLQKQSLLFDYNQESLQIKAINDSIKMVYDELQDELGTKLTRESHKLDPTHQDLLKKKFTIETKLEMNAVRKKEVGLQISKFQQRIEAIEYIVTDWRALVNDIKHLESYEKELLKKLTQISAIEHVGFSEVEILDRAIPPRYPKIRNLPLIFFIILGFFLGAVFSTAFFVWREEIVRRVSVKQSS
jgi:uncharacterized protein involved in exopolysaccharide biosynthesis